jgi:hypothetical protein
MYQNWTENSEFFLKPETHAENNQTKKKKKNLSIGKSEGVGADQEQTIRNTARIGRNRLKEDGGGGGGAFQVQSEELRRMLVTV